MKIYAITGGSGTGKSTVTYRIVDDFPDQFNVIHLDDFQRKKRAPMNHGLVNWDHPDCIDFESLIICVKNLKNNQTAQYKSWDPRANPDYKKTGEKSIITMRPKNNLILEGYLTLHNPELQKLIDQSFFLNLDEKTRLTRRNKFLNPSYRDQILIPMHNEFVEPQKEHATHIINVEDKTVAEVRDYILKEIGIN